MSKTDSSPKSDTEVVNIDFMRSLVKQYSELGQWTSALFWADLASSASSEGGTRESSGEDIWLLASAMLANGEYHRAAHAITSRELHKKHLLCLGVACRAMLAAKEPAAVLTLIEECDPILMEMRNNDHTHNRALASVLVHRSTALFNVERREAAIEALTNALRTDVTCFEALHQLLDKHSLTPQQERELLDSLPIKAQLGPAEAMLLRSVYHHRIHRYSNPVPPSETPASIDQIRANTEEAVTCAARRLTNACQWAEALKLLKDPWNNLDIRTACLVELKKSTELFTFAHTLVDSYPTTWQAWYAVGCYYYLIGKSEFARRYLSKAKTIDPSVGCIWLAYGHSFAADNEHDQAMAAYFKASQLMPGCHLPRLYVGVECSLLNNVNVAQRFFVQASKLYPRKSGSESESREETDWMTVCISDDAHIQHEAGVAAYNSGDFVAAEKLFLSALKADTHSDSSPRWATTLDALGHTVRNLGRPEEALSWHSRALSLRPLKASSLTALGLCMAKTARLSAAAETLHAALAKDPDDAPASSLLEIVIEQLCKLQEESEECPQFPFPPTSEEIARIPPREEREESGLPVPFGASVDATNTSDMSMSFD